MASEHRVCNAVIRDLRALLDSTQGMVEDAVAFERRRADRILDAYHMSYRHGPDPDPKRCPACHAAALEDE